MIGSRHLIPTTSMLIAFEAAARLNGFTAAAQELNLTQGAVSRQIAALEQQLNVQLFTRAGKRVQISEAGRIYAQDIAGALQTIRSASLNVISSPKVGILNLAILPTFGMRWLMPRFPGFLQKNPHITVNFITKLTTFDFRNENIHAAIHFGEPNWPNTESTFLMAEEVVAVAAPMIIDGQQIVEPSDLVNLPLLHLETRPNAWANWFAGNDLKLPQNSGTVFEQFAIVTQAAIAGMGAALLPRFLIETELERGDLVVLFDAPIKSEAGYYLVTPTQKSGYAPVIALREWLLSEIDKT